MQVPPRTLFLSFLPLTLLSFATSISLTLTIPLPSSTPSSLTLHFFFFCASKARISPIASSNSFSRSCVMPMTGACEAKLSELVDRLILPSPPRPALPFAPTPALAFRFPISFFRYAVAGDAKKAIIAAVPMMA